MPDNPVKAKISVMNWVHAADDASKVTAEDGLKDAEKLDSNIRILFSLAGNYLANQNPDLHQATRVLGRRVENRVYRRKRSVYDA